MRPCDETTRLLLYPSPQSVRVRPNSPPKLYTRRPSNAAAINMTTESAPPPPDLSQSGDDATTTTTTNTTNTSLLPAQDAPAPGETTGRPRTATTTAEIDSTIIHPGSVKINVKGAFIVEEGSRSPGAHSLSGRSGSPDNHHQTKDIRLPNHTAVVSHIAVDVSQRPRYHHPSRISARTVCLCALAPVEGNDI